MDDKFNDIWEMSDEEGNLNYDNIISSKEWNRMNENFGNLGYKEGIIEGKDTTIQKGFDKGYIDGARIGKEIENELANLSVEKIFTKEYFKQVINSSDNIDKSQEIIINDTGTECSIHKLNIGSNEKDKDDKKDEYEKDKKDNNLEIKTEILKNVNDLSCCDNGDSSCCGDDDSSCCGDGDSSCCKRNECSKFIPQTKIMGKPVEQLLKKYYKEINNLLTASGFDQI
ncbi:7257_t:CDS:2 [Diversispora eburnea]|uniref:Protein YAE1 n=1 Tax=Diversispora eburnea TaxID=1213867 RepID=A0A9N8UXT3_9GLOM|nr:7257_t:CDS:2 [Diversispora eburnea]